MNINGPRVHTLFAAPFIAAFLLMVPGIKAQNLFVADYGGFNGVFEVTPSASQSNFASGFGAPFALAFNAAGTLFVADGNNNSIVEVMPSGAKNTFVSGLNTPYGLAFDSAGNLFESDYGSSTIFEFTNSNGTLSSNATAFVSGLTGPVGLAFNRAGNLFEADFHSGNIYEFTNNSGTLNPTPGLFTSGLNMPGGLAFDGTGDLFVANFSGTINEFTNNSGTLNPAPDLFASGLSHPLGLAFNGAGNLFVANQLGYDVVEITPGGVQSNFVSEVAGDYPSAVAFQPVPQLQSTAVAHKTCLVSVVMPSPYFSTVVQASTNLVNWTVIYTNTPPFTYTDSITAQVRYRFYRAFVGH